MYAKLKRKFGQNFLIDKNILKKINKLIDRDNLNILEIGPGTGNLTEYILQSKPSNLTIIEVDKDLIDILNKKFLKFDKINVVYGDFLKTNINTDIKFDLVISNLPYNISSQILLKLSLNTNRPKRMILMFQKEFADKLLEKKLNSLNSIIKCFYEINKRFEISNKSFLPVPKVKSTILEFNLLNESLINENEINNFIIFKRKIFNKKRKAIGTIIKNLKNDNISSEILKLRAEDLSLKEFIDLYSKINF